jgi:hypothetical protein
MNERIIQRMITNGRLPPAFANCAMKITEAGQSRAAAQAAGQIGSKAAGTAALLLTIVDTAGDIYSTIRDERDRTNMLRSLDEYVEYLRTHPDEPLSVERLMHITATHGSSHMLLAFARSLRNLGYLNEARGNLQNQLNMVEAEIHEQETRSSTAGRIFSRLGHFLFGGKYNDIVPVLCTITPGGAVPYWLGRLGFQRSNEQRLSMLRDRREVLRNTLDNWENIMHAIDTNDRRYFKEAFTFIVGNLVRPILHDTGLLTNADQSGSMEAHSFLAIMQAALPRAFQSIFIPQTPELNEFIRTADASKYSYYNGRLMINGTMTEAELTALLNCYRNDTTTQNIIRNYYLSSITRSAPLPPCRGLEEFLREPSHNGKYRYVNGVLFVMGKMTEEERNQLLSFYSAQTGTQNEPGPATAINYLYTVSNSNTISIEEAGNLANRAYTHRRVDLDNISQLPSIIKRYYGIDEAIVVRHMESIRSFFGSENNKILHELILTAKYKLGTENPSEQQIVREVLNLINNDPRIRSQYTGPRTAEHIGRVVHLYNRMLADRNRRIVYNVFVQNAQTFARERGDLFLPIYAEDMQTKILTDPITSPQVENITLPWHLPEQMSRDVQTTIQQIMQTRNISFVEVMRNMKVETKDGRTRIYYDGRFFDNPTIININEAFLRDLGYDTSTVASGEDLDNLTKTVALNMLLALQREQGLSTDETAEELRNVIANNGEYITKRTNYINSNNTISLADCSCTMYVDLDFWSAINKLNGLRRNTTNRRGNFPGFENFNISATSRVSQGGNMAGTVFYTYKIDIPTSSFFNANGLDRDALNRFLLFLRDNNFSTPEINAIETMIRNRAADLGLENRVNYFNTVKSSVLKNIAGEIRLSSSNEERFTLRQVDIDRMRYRSMTAHNNNIERRDRDNKA